tara:strand:- start:1144 stop:2262 length:1119 start_codon:yes stop_codon:yes gene_type:complete
MLRNTVDYCKTCLTPNSRPRTVFNSNGICNACVNALEKKKVDWESRRKLFQETIKPFKSNPSGYDCIVPWSGGKDSSYIAYRLKYEFGLNPLLVTVAPLIPTETGIHNRNEILNLGFDHLYVKPNEIISRSLSQRFFKERGNPKMHWDAAVSCAPMQVALNYKINLIFYAEHGDSEYGGRVLSEDSKKIRDLTEVLENCIGDDPSNWISDKISLKDLQPYLYPNNEMLLQSKITALYFSYFFYWDVVKNYEFIKTKIKFKLAEQNRTLGTFTNFDSLDDKIDDLYYYMQFIKFGFGRCVRDASRHIQNKYISRDEAIKLVKKYDGEFPSRYFRECLDYLELTEDEFYKIVDLHRNSEIWHKEKNNWELINKI